MITEVDVRHIIDTYYVENNVAEMMGLLKHVEAIAPKTIVEIGVCFGGSLLIWEKVVPEDGILIGVDCNPNIEAQLTGDIVLLNRPPAWKVENRFVHNGVTILKLRSSKQVYVVLADSATPKASAAVKHLLGDRKIDYFFHDGVHYATGPVWDYANFEDLIRVGALVCVGDVSDLTLEKVPNLGTQALWRAFPEPKIPKVEGHAQGMALWWKTEDFIIDPTRIIEEEGLDDHGPNAPFVHK